MIDEIDMSLLDFKYKLKQRALWIWHGKYHLLSCAAYIITVFYLTGFLKFYPTTVALLMSLLGLFILWRLQTSDAIKFSSHKPNTFMSWLKSIPTGKPRTLSINVSSAVSTPSGRINITSSISDDAKIERKVDFLLKQVAALYSVTAKLDEKIDSVNSSLNKAEKKVQASLDTLTTDISTIIAGHVVGAYDVNLFGINIVICGTLIQFFSS